MTEKVHVYLSYADMNCHAETKLGTLTINQVLALQNQIAQTSPTNMKCPNYINACFEYIDEVARGPKTPIQPTVQYNIHATFKYKDDIAKCCKKYQLRDGVQMTKMCAKNLRCGKCQDEFMRRTIGAALFPQFYGKDKQK